ncbi:unnamed protein product [Ectocarpus sp. 12 AP-2014]
MNWMTSGRKRVQRSQKVKELRAKHFAKVAADRSRAPVSRPARASSSTLNQQSVDVSRLKSRWTQQLSSTHKVSTLQRTVDGSAEAEHTTAENSTSPPSNVTTLGPGTTPDFQLGTLDLEVTPPFNATARQEQGSNSMARIPGAALPTDGPRRGSSDDNDFERPLRHHPRQQRPTASFRGGRLLLRAQPDDCPHRHTLLPLERRQLVFGGGRGTAEQQGFGNSYEEQPIGSECAGIGDGVSNSSGSRVEEDRYQRGHALPGDGSAGTAGAAADSEGTNADHKRTPRVTGQLGRASDPVVEHTMRFFNDGFAVAQDGSPVVDGPLTATSSATTVAASSVGGLVFPTNDHDNNRDTNGTEFGVRESGNTGGLPRFSIAGGLRDGNCSSPLATPAGLWKENMLSDYRSNRQYALESSSASDFGPDFSGHAPAEEQVQPRGRHHEDVSEVHHQSQGEYDADLEQGPMLDNENLMNPPPRDAAPPAFDMLARTWGLFGGALDATTPTAFDASGSNSAKGRDTSEERAVREASFRHGRDGETGVPPLHASVPVRATPQAVVGQGDQSPEPIDADAEHPDAFESLQSPLPPSTPTSAEDYDRGCEDGRGSPELMMHFCQGPELEVVVTGSQTDAEALEGEPNNSSQPTKDGIPVTAGDARKTPERQHEASLETFVSPQLADPKVGHNQEVGEQQPRQADLNTFTASQGPKSAATDERDVAPLPANGGDSATEAQHDIMRRLRGRPPQVRTVNDTEPGGSGGIGGGGGSVGEDGGSIKTVSQDIMPPGDLQLRPGRSSTPNGRQSCGGREAAPAKPSSFPHPSTAVPSAEVPSSSYGQDRKRARDAGEEEEGKVQRQDHQSEAGSELPVGNGGGGFRAARLSGKARRLQLEVKKASTCGSGEREGEVGDGNVRQGRMERDSGSTIVWYQTIVACLAAPP